MKCYLIVIAQPDQWLRRRGSSGHWGGGGRDTFILYLHCRTLIIIANGNWRLWEVMLAFEFFIERKSSKAIVMSKPLSYCCPRERFFYVNYQEGIILRLINFQDAYKCIYRSISFQTHPEPFVSSQTQTGRLCFKFQFQLIIRYI